MIRNSPLPSLTAVRTFSISAGLAASTVTPGRTAPDVSLIKPVMDACARAAVGTRTMPTNTSNAAPHVRICPPILPLGLRLATTTSGRLYLWRSGHYSPGLALGITVPGSRPACVARAMSMSAVVRHPLERGDVEAAGAGRPVQQPSRGHLVTVRQFGLEGLDADQLEGPRAQWLRFRILGLLRRQRLILARHGLARVLQGPAIVGSTRQAPHRLDDGEVG